MHNASLRLLYCALLAVALAAGCKSKDDEEKEVADTAVDATVVVVNGTPITASDFDDYMERKKNSQDGAEPDPKEAMEEMVNIELILQEAVKAGFDKRPEVVKELERRRKNLIVDAFVLERLRDTQFTDEQLKTKYEEEVAKLPTQEFRARHILAKTEGEAVEAIDALKSGGDFAKIAKEKSVDPTAAKGGELGWFRLTAMVPSFAAAIEKLEVGAYTQTPVESQFGWHVIQLEEKRDTPKPDVPPFEQVKDRMRTALAGEAVQSYVQELRAKSKVEVVNEKP
jgi:peptidyl-prolyl cis-trans isomerase C